MITSTELFADLEAILPSLPVTDDPKEHSELHKSLCQRLADYYGTSSYRGIVVECVDYLAQRKSQTELGFPDTDKEVAYETPKKTLTDLLEGNNCRKLSLDSPSWRFIKEDIKKMGINTKMLEHWMEKEIDRKLDQLFIQGTHKYAQRVNFSEEIQYFTTLSILSSLYTAEKVRHGYDLGIAIARGGLYPAFLLSQVGLPIMTVEMKRRGKSASWKPCSDYDISQISGKRILFIDDDIATGKTLRRAVREVLPYSPADIGACFMYSSIRINLTQLPPEINESYALDQNNDTQPDWNRWIRETAHRFLG